MKRRPTLHVTQALLPSQPLANDISPWPPLMPHHRAFLTNSPAKRQNPLPPLAQTLEVAGRESLPLAAG